MSHLIIVNPRDKGELHRRHKDVGLNPPNGERQIKENLLIERERSVPDVKLSAGDLRLVKRIVAVTVASNHVGEDEWVAYI